MWQEWRHSYCDVTAVPCGHPEISATTASIRGTSMRWMYPDSWNRRHRRRAKSPPSLLPLQALWPGTAHSGDSFGDPGNARLVLYNTHFFTRGGCDVPAVILLHITLAGDVESNPGPPKIYTCHLLPTHYQQQKIQGLCSMHLLQRLGPHYQCEHHANALDSYLTVQAASSAINIWYLYSL